MMIGQPWDAEPPRPDELLPHLTCSLRLDYARDFRHGFARVDFRDASGYLLQTVTIDLFSGEKHAENEACDDLQQMEQKASYLVWCYGLQQLFTERDPLRERLINQKDK